MRLDALDRRGPDVQPQSSQRRGGRSAQSRVRIDGGRLVLRSLDLFQGDGYAARRVINHAFTLDQVRTIAVRRERGEISILLAPLADAGDVWRRLGALIRGGVVEGPNRAARLDLAGPLPGLPVRVARAGRALTTFRARVLSPEHLRIGHPLLRDRDIRHRFIDLLRAVHGVSDIRKVGFRPEVVVSYDAAVLEAEHILRLIEGAWPEVLAGPPVPARPRKLFIAAGLLAFSFVAQFFRPALLPWATAAAVLYSLPNVIGAIRDLARGRIGLYAMYSAGLGFLLWTRLPFAAGVMATLFQLWPALAQRVVMNSERRLFAERRRRLAWARLNDPEGHETLVGLDDLTPGSTVLVRAGEFVPADGVILDGHGAVEEDMLGGARGSVDRSPGDSLYARSFVRDGAVTLRVIRTGQATTAAALTRALPHGALQGLPSSADVERIANRNARPALAVAAMLLLATRVPRFSQVIIRPDYATGPRLSAHLSALKGLAEALAQGALVRRPGALDLLPSVEAFFFDDGADLSSRAVTIKTINVARRSAATDVVRLAAAALAGSNDPRAAALQGDLDDLGVTEAKIHHRRQRAGETIFRDAGGEEVCVATPLHALRLIEATPSGGLRPLIQRLATDPPVDPAERPVVIVRNRRIAGVVQFARLGEHRFAEAIAALRAQYPEARFVNLSSARQEIAEAAAEGLGFDAVFGGLSPEAKAGTLQSLGLRGAWIGDGTASQSAIVRAASAVSISLGGLGSLPRDEADIVLLRDDPAVLLALRPIVDAHVARLAADYRTVYLANLLAVAGGFVAGFGSLGAGLTSNVGSALVFLRRWRGLAALSAGATRDAGARLATLHDVQTASATLPVSHRQAKRRAASSEDVRRQ